MGKKDQNRRENIRDKRRKQLRQQRLTLILIVVGIVLLVIALLIIPSIIGGSKPVAQVTPIQTKQIPQANGSAMGDPNAPVKVIEYSDYQCPACQYFQQQVEPQLVETYVATGKVYFEYRSMGSSIGPESADAAMAAYCAGDQKKFWEYHDIVFTNQGGENVGALSKERLQAFAQSIGLDIKVFNDCFSSGKYQNRVTQDEADGKKAGVDGTPSFQINGKLVKGFTDLWSEIDLALQSSTTK